MCLSSQWQERALCEREAEWEAGDVAICLGFTPGRESGSVAGLGLPRSLVPDGPFV